MKDKVNIVVVGGGVMGIGTALAILQKIPNCNVTIIAQHFTPNTTGDGAAGIWEPHLITNTPHHKIVEWSEKSFKLFESWWLGNEEGKCASRMGVSEIYGNIVSDEDIEMKPWHNIQSYAEKMTPQQYQLYGSHVKGGLKGGTYTAEPSKFLPVLLKEVQELGGKLQIRTLTSLQEAAQNAHILINCSGLGARYLVPDSSVYPIRGQVIRVRAPWIKNYLCDDSLKHLAYIIPNQDTVVLGGTQQENNWSTEVNPQDSQTILHRCTKLIPSLKNAEVVKEWVGLRPARSNGVRLEADYLKIAHRNVPVVHNYGHGGSGVTMFWGCSVEAANITAQLIQKHYPFEP